MTEKNKRCGNTRPKWPAPEQTDIVILPSRPILRVEGHSEFREMCSDQRAESANGKYGTEQLFLQENGHYERGTKKSTRPLQRQADIKLNAERRNRKLKSNAQPRAVLRLAVQ